MSSTLSTEFYPTLANNIQSLTEQFETIPSARKNLLKELTNFITYKVQSHQTVSLIFICTHNSRRSHISQLWAQAAATYYRIENVFCFSGGTEATAFNYRAVKAMKEAGFQIEILSDTDNPVYTVQYTSTIPAQLVFSKQYNAVSNPREHFAAVMTCSHADENCPIVHGMEKRISLPYDDPKDSDGTAQEEATYRERVMEIGKEILFAFSQVELN